MRIRIKAKGVPTGKLPEGATSAGADMDLPDGATPADAMTTVGVNPADGYLVMIGDQAVAPSDVSIRQLQDGDILTILPPLKGG